MPAFASYTAWIEVDNVPLSEYSRAEDIQPDGSTKVSCWIPSAAGKTFKIGYSQHQRLGASQVHFAVDGSPCPTGQVLRNPGPPFPLQGKYIKDYREGVETSSGFFSFSFANCQLTDDDSVSGSVEGVGEIEVHFYDCDVVGSYVQEAMVEFDGAESDQLLQPRQIHERAKKGLVHSVQLEKTAVSPPGRIMEYYDTIKGPRRATFLFRYRPLDVLRADDIAPRPAPTPRTHPTKKRRAVIDLTLPEPTPKKLRTIGGVIDLTLDSDDDDEVKDEGQAHVRRPQGDMAAAKRRVDQKRKMEETGEGPSRRLKRVKSEAL